MVHRIEAKVALTEDRAKALKTDFASIFEHAFIDSVTKPDPTCKRQQIVEELTKVVHENLDEEGIVSFQEAIAKGIRPRADDNEELKTETTAPDCCSKRSSVQR